MNISAVIEQTLHMFDRDPIVSLIRRLIHGKRSHMHMSAMDT